MASLDDFFAKKDKSKKGKKNKLTPEELAKQLEVQSSGYHSKKKDDDYGGHRGSDLISNSKLFDQNDEEWKDFEDDREKDYRGLKIVSLNLRGKEEEMLEKQRVAQEKIAEKSRDDSGPWNKHAEGPAPVTEEPKPEPKPEIEKEDVASKESKSDLGGGIGKSRYLPPALRNTSSSSGDNTIKPTTMAAAVRKLPKGSLPKIDDAQDFPSLSIVD
ncbi:protein CDV3 homolog [Panonychus citri]|uniref:protein CDV3 homolog n=1 Tax=Panonychus citri TaxID=50023 RepID=UPI002307D07A|nr:protein CDV3 homolog [Panonychus citri]